MKTFFSILSVCFMLNGSIANGEVYKVVNPDGTVSYTDTTRPGAKAIKIYLGSDKGNQASEAIPNNANREDRNASENLMGGSVKEQMPSPENTTSNNKSVKRAVTSNPSTATSGSSASSGGSSSSSSTAQASSGSKGTSTQGTSKANVTNIGKTTIPVQATTVPSPAKAAPAALFTRPDGFPLNWPWHGFAIDSFTSGNDPSIIPDLKHKGVNSVELILSVRQEAFYRNKSVSQAWAETLRWADKMLDACQENGIVAVVTLVQFPIDPALGITQSSAEFWDSPHLLDDALSVIGVLVEHFKNRGPELAAYEFLNEPLLRRNGKQESPAVWTAFQQRIIEEVRKQDKERFIVVNAGFGGEASYYRTMSEPLNDKRIIYGAHVYNPHEFTHQGIAGSTRGISWPGRIAGFNWNKAVLERQMLPLIEFKLKNDVPVWIGEFSAIRWAPGASTWLCDAVSIFNKYEFGWAYFAFNGYHGWNPNYNTHYSSDKPEDFQVDYVGAKSTRWSALERMLSGKCD